MKRIFKPMWPNTTIARWVWTRRKGLLVVYSDGFTCKSSWGSLREFLKACREGREHAKEVL